MSNKVKKLLSREQYKKVKKMDHTDMSVWVESIYSSGFQDGKNAVPGVDLKEILATIMCCKGVGDKTFQGIRTALEEKFESGVKGNDSTT